MSERILIIGATGNIGSSLVTELQGLRANVFAGIRKNDKRSAPSPDLPSIPFDFEKPTTMKEAFSKVDRAFLLLPLSEHMVAYGKTAIDAAREAGLSFLVKSSELGANSTSSKLALQAQGSVDRYLMDSGIKWSILRPNFFMQNFSGPYATGIREHNGIFLPQGDARISLIDVRDIAAVAAQILLAPNMHAGQSYDLTGPEALSNAEIAQHLSNVAGRQINYQATSDDATIEAMSQRGISPWIVEFVMSLHRHVRDGMMNKVSSIVRDITCREAAPFAHFAQEHASTWKAAAQPAKAAPDTDALPQPA